MLRSLARWQLKSHFMPVKVDKNGVNKFSQTATANSKPKKSATIYFFFL